MGSNWEEYYSKTPKPSNFNEQLDKIQQFMVHHRSKDKKIVLVTSGGTTVPLEHNTVRFVDNFSAGTRGSSSAEMFLEYGYLVIFLYRLKSLEPFVRHLSGQNIFDVLEVVSRINQISIKVADSKVPEILPIIRKYKMHKAAKNILYIPFTTLSDYLWFLRGCCEFLAKKEKKALIYLAAAVSDFYIPMENLPEHKIPSADGPLNITLQLTPKILEPLVSTWVPKGFIVSFKLETDENLVVEKARDALNKYQHHLVIGNTLQTRKQKVYFVTKDDVIDLKLTPEEIKKGVEIESKIIPNVTNRHDEFIAQVNRGSEIS